MPAEKRVFPTFEKYLMLSRDWFAYSLSYYKKTCTDYMTHPFVAYLYQDPNLSKTLNQVIEIVYSSQNTILRSMAPIELCTLVDLVLREAADIKDVPFVLQDDQVLETATLEKSLISHISKDVSISPPTGPPPQTCYAIKYTASEVTNPYSWPLLVHETLHIVEEVKSIYAQLPILSKVDLPVENAEDWKRELFIDLYCVLFFGPIFAFSMVGKFRLTPYVSTKTHPPMEVRIQAIRKYLDKVTPPKPIGIAEETLFKIVSETRPYLVPATVKDPKLDKAVEDFVNSFCTFTSKKSFQQLLVNWFPSTSTSLGIPKVSFDNIRGWTKEGMELAIDPRILLNFVLTDPEIVKKAPGRVPEELTRALLSSMKKWRVFQAYRGESA